MCTTEQDYRDALGLARFEEEGTRAEAIEVAHCVIEDLGYRGIRSLDQVETVLKMALEAIAEVRAGSDGRDMCEVMVGSHEDVEDPN